MKGELDVLIKIRVFADNEVGPIAFENILATFHGFCDSKISFELVSIHGEVFYFIRCSKFLSEFIKSQIYAFYPEVEIDVVTEYLPSNYHKLRVCLMNADIFPIKRYAQFEDKLNQVMLDPVAGIVSSFSGDFCALKFEIKPLSNYWRSVYGDVIRVLANGFLSNFSYLRKLFLRFFLYRNIFVRFLFFPVYFLFYLRCKLINNDIVDEFNSKTHDREFFINSAVDKVIRPLFEVEISIFATEKVTLLPIFSSLKQFDLPHLNGFKIGNLTSVLSNEELATIYHLPLVNTKISSLHSVFSKKLEPPRLLPQETVLGVTNYRDKKVNFGIKSDDRRRHVYIIGKTGMGKSTLLENLIYQDVISGKGVAVIDPHGDLCESILGFVPSKRINDVIYVNPADQQYSISLNLLDKSGLENDFLIVSGVVAIFKKIFGDSWGPRLEYILRNTLLTLISVNGMSFLAIPRLLQDEKFRKDLLSRIDDLVLLNFWHNEFDLMSDKLRIEAISPILNKVGQFLSSRLVRNIVGQSKSTIDLRFAMDNKKIVLVNLSKGKIGEDASTLLGSLLVTKFQLDAMGRANTVEKERKDFYLYVDEFQNFATESFATILSEARKYKLNLTLANQYISQMPDSVRDAVFGNVGSLISFQVGIEDAKFLSEQFGQCLTQDDLTSLPKYNAYIKLLMDGMPTKTFSFNTLNPVKPNYLQNISKIVKVSRERYANKIFTIEARHKKWSLTPYNHGTNINK